MAFHDLEPQSDIFPAEAADYASTALRRSEQAALRCRTVLDVAYGDDPHHKLDLYLPADAALKDCPVLVFAHGGGWTHGYKEWMGLMAPPLVERGIVFVSVGHRLAPAAKYPLPMEDCAAALGWVHRHVGEHGGNPQRIAIGGHSSGGHLYAMVGFRPDVLARHGVPLSTLVAVAPLCARLDLDFEGRLPGSTEERHQQVLLTDPSQAQDASPIHWVGQDAPHTLIAWASHDVPGCSRSSRMLAQRMAAIGASHETLELANTDHFAAALNCGDANDPWVQRIVAILVG
jgi:acetyl esterase/lipase